MGSGQVRQTTLVSTTLADYWEREFCGNESSEPVVVVPGSVWIGCRTAGRLGCGVGLRILFPLWLR